MGKRRAHLMERGWLALPQVMSRASSVVIFALIANNVGPEELGAFAVATAISAASLALAPALVGKPLAVLGARGRAGQEARSAQSAALLGSFVAGIVLLTSAVATHGLVRLALLGGAIGVPAVMIVESSFWRDAFTRGSRHAGSVLSAAYAIQTIAVVAAVITLDTRAAVLSPFVSLGSVGVLVLLARRDVSLKSALVWFRERRPSWLPYVLGVAASVVLVQAIPIVITATAGFQSASVYRAGELAFGGTNLLIGIATQTLLARSAANPRAAYIRLTVILGIVAALNGIFLALLPDSILQAVVGPAEPLLRDVLPIITVQRCALAVSSVGAILLVPLITARRFGLLDVVAAGTALAALVVGGVLGGLPGALSGLAAAEVLLSLMYFRLLRKAT